ncbi:Uncharacterised protein [Klebsiella pneumoniae]|nr:Uncharacterised protein [Klebsiella pneumoniae]
MRKVKLNNDDLIQYLNTINTLKQYPTMSEYREQYRRLRTDGSPLSEAKKFKSAHTELLRLDRKKKSLLDKFIEELGNDSNLLIVFYVQIMPDDFVMQLHRF